MSDVSVRLQREVAKLIKKPPSGITCFPFDDSYKYLTAIINGSHNTPYENGMFEINIEIPSNYPFSPPRLRFITKIYHPNIDEVGRICMDILKVQPEGCWKPTYTIEGILIAIQTLMNQPNPDHPLVATIANQYKYNKLEFDKKAREWTIMYAKPVDESNSKNNE